MILATYKCGCIPPKKTWIDPVITNEPYCQHCRSLLKQETNIPCHPCPKKRCCLSPLRCAVPIKTTPCRMQVPPCPNFDNIKNCTCSPKSGDICNDEQCDAEKSKIVSEIVSKGLPYKEIEAIINDNRMVVRMQKESIEEEYDPVCECPGGEKTTAIKKSTTSINESKSTNPCNNDVVYEMTDVSKPGYTYGEQSSMVKRTCDQSNPGCRTITMYSHPGVESKIPTVAVPTLSPEERLKIGKKEKRDKQDKPKINTSIDQEENPNIFVLRIRKKSENFDRKHNIDLEFRTPRPWLPQKESKKIVQLTQPPTIYEKKEDKRIKRKKIDTKSKRKRRKFQ